MIVLRSGDEGARRRRTRLAIVGKGVCFDSGGISISRPIDGRNEDGQDGLHVIAPSRPWQAAPARRCWQSPDGGNMPDAFRGGDIVRHERQTSTSSTPSEGADLATHVYARSSRHYMVDIATLTGAGQAWRPDDRAFAPQPWYDAVARGEKPGRYWQLPFSRDRKTSTAGTRLHNTDH